MRILITGVTGFVGSHLAEYGLSRGAEIWGTRRCRSPRDNIEHIADLNLVEMDLLDAVSVRAVVEKVRPSWIFHLAAQSYVPSSWSAPEHTIATNILGQLHLLEGLRDRPATRVLVAGTSEEYGLVAPGETPITEEAPLRPLSPYGVSKVGQDLLGYQYHRSYGMHVVRTRAFNHGGPRRGEQFVPSVFAKQIAEIEEGLKPPVIRVGNLDAVRDFTDVRDIVRAYWLALEVGQPGEVYNIGSGNALTIRYILDTLLAMSEVSAEIRPVPEQMRPSDVPVLVSDSTKFRALTGWEPEISPERMLADTLEYWRERVSRSVVGRVVL